MFWVDLSQVKVTWYEGHYKVTVAMFWVDLSQVKVTWYEGHYKVTVAMFWDDLHTYSSPKSHVTKLYVTCQI